MEKISDFEIIESVKKGNQEDFSILVERYSDRAFNMLKRMLKNQMDAEEALQDAFVKAYSSLSSFRKEAKYSTWFYRITYNTGLTVLAGKKRQIEKEMSSIDEHFDLGEFDNKIYSETEHVKDYIQKMVDQLPVRSSLIIILFYIDNLSLNEISQILNISLVNTKVMLHRSRNALREVLLQHNFEEEIL